MGSIAPITVVTAVATTAIGTAPCENRELVLKAL